MQVTTANMATYVGSANWVLRSTVVSSANWVARSDSALYLQSTPNTLVTNNYTGIVTFKSPIILNNVTSSAVVSTGDINIAITVNGTLYYIKASRSL